MCERYPEFWVNESSVGREIDVSPREFARMKKVQDDYEKLDKKLRKLLKWQTAL